MRDILRADIHVEAASSLLGITVKRYTKHKFIRLKNTLAGCYAEQSGRG